MLTVGSLMRLENRTESRRGGLKGEIIIAAFRPIKSKDISLNRLQVKSCVKECVHAQKWTSSDRQQAGKNQQKEFWRKLNEGGRQPPIPITI